MQMQQECEVLYGNMLDGLDGTLRDMYTNSYYHTAYEFMKGHGVGWAFNRLDDRRIEKAINTVWTNDGKRFSDRVWANKSKLVQELNTVLTQNIIRGESPQRAISQLAKRMNVSRSRAGTLIMTESAFIHSQSQKDCYSELDVEKLQFVATLDNSTSEICRSMDGVVIDMKDYKIGLNVPPLHPRCRSCMIPYYEDNVGMRAARGEDGKTYLVPSDMTYKDWKKSFVDGDVSDLTPINSDLEELTRLENEKVAWLKEQGYDYAEDMEQEFWNTAKAFGDMGAEVKYMTSLNDIISKLRQKLGLQNSNVGNIIKVVEDVTTFDELEKYLLDKYSIAMQDTVKQLDLLRVRQSLSGIESVFNEYPELANVISTIETSTSGIMSCTGKKITFNPSYYSQTSQSLIDICNDMSQIGYWTKNATLRSIGVHEAGHGVEWLIIQTDPGYMYDFERTMAWNKCSEAQSIVKQAIDEIKKTPYGKGKGKVDLVKAISEYANDTDSETIAEAFADVYANGSNANPLSIEIKKVTMERYKQYKGGGNP